MKHITPKSKPLPNMSAFSQDYEERHSGFSKTTPQTPCKPQYTPYGRKNEDDLMTLLHNDGFHIYPNFTINGFHSTIYKMIQKDTGIEYVLKLIKKTNSYTQEYEISCEFDSPYTVQYLKKYEYDGGIALVIEYQRGGSLNDRIQSGFFIDKGEDEIRRAGKDILRGLLDIHKKGILHLDIKPENIFISSTGMYKIGDFGKSIRIYKRGKEDDLFVNPSHLSFDDDPFDSVEGDKRYMAKELLDNVVTKKADMFSFGMTLLEMSTKLKIPGEGEPWLHLREGNIPEIYTSGKDRISETLRSIIVSLLNPNAKERPSASELLANDFFIIKERRFSNPVQYTQENMMDMTSSSLPKTLYFARFEAREYKRRKSLEDEEFGYSVSKKLF